MFLTGPGVRPVRNLFINKPVVLLRLFAAYFVSAGIKSGKYTDLIRVGLGRYA